MNNQDLIIEIKNNVGWIKLNRSKALNALSLDMVQGIYDQLEAWKDDEAIKCVCLTSTIEKAFCAGGDVKSVYNHIIRGNQPFASLYLTSEYKMDYQVQSFPKPIIVYMNGIVMGGGVGLSIGGTYRIVTEKTKWSMPEMNIGFFPDVGMSYYFNQFPGFIGRYLGLTASIIKAEDLMYLGVADYFIPSENWPTIEQALYTNEWNEDFEEQLTALLNQFSKTTTESRLKDLEEKINRHFSHPTMEEIVHSLKNDPDPWAQEVLQVISNYPPTSLKATLELLKRNKGKSLFDCLKQEANLGVNLSQTANFKEGVRAVLVDKDRQYKWNPKELHEVTEEEVNHYFQSSSEGKHPLD